MSRGRGAISGEPNARRERVALVEFVDGLVRQGKSFSGHERHCFFLNTGSQTPGFADASAVTGFDYSDDGRAVARVDWDHDGDLDFWIANRSGPQLRFLRNDWESDGGFLSLYLIGNGTTSNRDAIGARVEVVLEENEADPDARNLIKALRAGDGFMSQSSKWMHFGLGSSPGINRVVVRWPGGEPETFAGMVPNERYRLVQDSGRPEQVRMERLVRLKPSRQETPPRGDTGRTFAAFRVPVPNLAYQTFGGTTTNWFAQAPLDEPGNPVLLQLWASWCPPCVAELKRFATQEERLRAAGLNIVALSIEALDGNAGGAEAASRFIRSIAFPFSAGLATAAVADAMQELHDVLFDMHRPLPLPTSMLVDANGQLAALYKGPVELQVLLDDVANLESSPNELRRRSVPFPGRWIP